MLLLKIVAAIAYISLGLPDSILGLAWPELSKDLGVDINRIGLLTGSTFAGYLVSSSLAATLAKRLGLGWLLVSSAIAMACVMLAYALTDHFYVLVLFGFIGGLGGGAIDAALNSYTAHRFTIRMVNWLHGCWGIGAFAGPLLMTAVLAMNLPWRASYFILSAALLLTAGLLYWTRSHWDEATHDQHDSTRTSSTLSSLTGKPITYWEVLSNRQVFGQCLLFFLYTGMESTVGLLFFTWWTQGQGISAETAGLAVTGYWFAFTLSRFGLGQIANYWGGEKLVKASAYLLPVTAALILFPPFQYVDLLLIVLYGSIISPIFPTWIGLTPHTVKAEYAPQAIGFQVSAAAIGIATIPGLIAWIASQTDLRFIPMALLINAVTFLVLQAYLLRTASVTPVEELALPVNASE